MLVGGGENLEIINPNLKSNETSGMKIGEDTDAIERAVLKSLEVPENINSNPDDQDPMVVLTQVEVFGKNKQSRTFTVETKESDKKQRD